MFTQSYTTPTVFAADPSILPRVSVAHFRDDKSLAETVNALLYDRIGEESFNADFAYCSLDAAKVRARSWMVENNNLLYLFLHDEPELNDFRTWAKTELNTPFVKVLERQSSEIRNRTGFSCSFYVREDDLAALVVCPEPDMDKWHMLQSFFFRLFRTLFTAKPLTDAEKNLLTSLTRSSLMAYISAAKHLADRRDLNMLKLRGELKEVRKFTYKSAIDSAKNQLLQLDSVIADLNRRYEQAMKDIETATIRLEGAKALAEKQDDNDELFEYFRDNDQIAKVTVDGAVIEVVIRTCLDLYDPDLYRDLAASGNIFRFNDGRSVEDHKLLMDAIFSTEPEFRIRMCGYYWLNMNGTVKSQMGYNYACVPECADHMPNPHLQRHACLGSYQPEIQSCLRAGNVVGAVEQCIASCMSVNLGETSMTFGPMIGDLFNSNKALLHREDGADMTVSEAIAYLKERKQNA